MNTDSGLGFYAEGGVRTRKGKGQEEEVEEEEAERRRRMSYGTTGTDGCVAQ